MFESTQEGSRPVRSRILRTLISSALAGVALFTAAGCPGTCSSQKATPPPATSGDETATPGNSMSMPAQPAAPAAEPAMPPAQPAMPAAPATGMAAPETKDTSAAGGTMEGSGANK